MCEDRPLDFLLPCHFVSVIMKSSVKLFGFWQAVSHRNYLFSSPVAPVCGEEWSCLLLEVFGEEQQNRLERLKRVEEEWGILKLHYFSFIMSSK